MSIQIIGGAANSAASYGSQGAQAPAQSPAPAASQAPPGQAAQNAPATAEQLESAVRNVQQAVQQMANNNLRFSVDKDTGRTVVRVVDTETGDVIRQIPSEEMMEIAKAVGQLQGLLLRQEA